MEKAEVFSFVSKELNIEIDKINDDFAMGDHPKWDSLAHMTLLSAIEKKLGRTLLIEETIEIEDVSDITEVLKDVDK